MELAARGDVKRLMQRTEAVRKRLGAAHDREDELSAAAAESRELQYRVGYGLCGNDSLVGKTLHNTLDAKSRAKFDAEMAAAHAPTIPGNDRGPAYRLGRIGAAERESTRCTG